MGALDVLFPPRCLGCGVPGRVLCPPCLAQVAVVTPPICGRCGRPAEEPLASCAACPPRPIARARAPFLYRGPIARAVRAVKFSGWRSLAPRLAAAMAEVADADADCITWVPLSRRRRAERGFDQAELLARALARRMGLEARRLLVRTRDTPPQASRPAGLRRSSSLRGAFASLGPAPPSVLLVDDVLTTGATAAACAASLLRAGAGRVSVVTAARALPEGPPARCLGEGRPGDCL